MTTGGWVLAMLAVVLYAFMLRDIAAEVTNLRYTFERATGARVFLLDGP